MFIKIHNSVIKGVCALGGSGLALSVTYGDSSPKGRALGMAGKFVVEGQSRLQNNPFCLAALRQATFPKGTALAVAAKFSSKRKSA